jgi:hypothetical protein
MRNKTFKGVAEQKDLGWFINCDVIDPYSQVPRMLPILKMQLFDFELIEGSEYRYELHLLQGKYVALLLPITDHVPDAKKMLSSQTEISDEEIEEMLFHHSNEYAYGFKDAIKWYREQLKQRQ